MADIIDDIDALVDWQLEQEASGYDHNINQVLCRCGRDWHGIPVTRAIERMRQAGFMDPGYVFADDCSDVLCVGSSTAGPWRPSMSDRSGRNLIPCSVSVSPSGQNRIYRVYEGPSVGQWWRCDRPQELEVEINQDTAHDEDCWLRPLWFEVFTDQCPPIGEWYPVGQPNRQGIA